MRNSSVELSLTSKTQRNTHINQPVCNRIADLRRVNSACEGNRLAEQGRTKNIDGRGKVDVVQRVEGGHAQRERITAGCCPA